MNNGNVNYNNKNNNNCVRAVSEFRMITMNAVYNISLDELFEAYWTCRRKKSRSRAASLFEADYEHNLIELREEINAGIYAPRASRAFVITRPDVREIFAADFRDRVVHTWIAQRVEPLLERRLVPTTFNGRKGKGTLAAAQYAGEALRGVSRNYTAACYVMKLDMKGFFMSIDRALICERFCRFVEAHYAGGDRATLLYLLRTVLLHAPEKHCVRCGDLGLWSRLPRHKSLFTNGEGLGLPIGDLISQMAANLLLDDTDHFLAETLGLTAARYVDDIVIVDRDKGRLLAAVAPIREFLRRSAGVTLHPRKFYLQHGSKGVKFIGAVVKPGRSYVANRTVGNCRCRIHAFDSRAREPGYVYRNAERLAASVNSYLGLMRHHASFGIRRRLVESLAPEWAKTVEVAEGYTKLTVRPGLRTVDRVRRRVKRKRI